MLNDFTGGGQIFLHKVRMFFQVLNRSFYTALVVAMVIVTCISYKQAKRLDIIAAISYQKALFANGLDDAMSGIREAINPKAKGYYTPINASTSKGVYARDVDPRKIIRSPLFKKAYKEVIVFLQTRLLMGLSVLAGVFLIIYIAWSRFGKAVKSEKRKAGSDKILSPIEVKRLLKAAKKASSFKIGEMPLVRDSETTHFLVTGSTGSGKTNLMHNILPQVEKEKQPAIVIDQTGEMIAKYYDPERGDIIFNPFDARSKRWDFWADCDTNEELKRFAKILFSFNRKKIGHNTDPFWEQSSEAVFIACANYLKAQDNSKSIEELCSLARTSSLDVLQAKLKNTEAARYLADNKITASSIMSVLTTNTEPLSYLRDCTGVDSFSLKQYFQDIDQGKNCWLFLATKPSSRDLTLSLLACLLELALAQLMDIGIRRDRRIWFVIDELSALGCLPTLATLMAEGRKYGACVLSGLQSLNQLYSNYGQYTGSTIFGQFGTKFFFRNDEPAIARMVSEMCGKETIYRQQKNTSYGAHEFRDGVSYTEHQQQKNLIEYSDLAGLNTGECFVLLPEPQVRIIKLQTPEAKQSNKNIGFIQSNITNSSLADELQKQNEVNEEMTYNNVQEPQAKIIYQDEELEKNQKLNQKEQAIQIN